jgi:outer membrane lipoprotein SlyB
MSSRNNATYNNEYTRSAARVGSYFAGAVVGGIAEAFVGGMSGGQVAVTTSGATVAMLAGTVAEFAFDEITGNKKNGK